MTSNPSLGQPVTDKTLCQSSSREWDPVSNREGQGANREGWAPLFKYCDEILAFPVVEVHRYFAGLKGSNKIDQIYFRFE